MIVYGRNPVREALRGRRAHAVSEIWTTSATAREPWLKQTGAKLATGEEIERRCGSSAHQGVCAEAGGYPYVSADELLGGDEPLIVVLDEATSGLDLDAIRALHRALDEVFADRTRLVITHRALDLQPSDLSWRLDAGRIRPTAGIGT